MIFPGRSCARYNLIMNDIVNKRNAPLVAARCIAGIAIWSIQIVIGGFAFYFKINNSFGVIITFFYGLPVGMILCVLGGLIIPKNKRGQMLMYFGLPLLISFLFMIAGIIGLKDT